MGCSCTRVRDSISPLWSKTSLSEQERSEKTAKIVQETMTHNHSRTCNLLACSPMDSNWWGHCQRCQACHSLSQLCSHWSFWIFSRLQFTDQAITAFLTLDLSNAKGKIHCTNRLRKESALMTSCPVSGTMQKWNLCFVQKTRNNMQQFANPSWLGVHAGILNWNNTMQSTKLWLFWVLCCWCRIRSFELHNLFSNFDCSSDNKQLKPDTCMRRHAVLSQSNGACFPKLAIVKASCAMHAASCVSLIVKVCCATTAAMGAFLMLTSASTFANWSQLLHLSCFDLFCFAVTSIEIDSPCTAICLSWNLQQLAQLGLTADCHSNFYSSSTTLTSLLSLAHQTHICGHLWLHVCCFYLVGQLPSHIYICWCLKVTLESDAKEAFC